MLATGGRSSPPTRYDRERLVGPINLEIPRAEVDKAVPRQLVAGVTLRLSSRRRPRPGWP
ncbi:MAG: hypothetical protein NVSMB42_15220 [Herpetosiphon sp.]